jgi:hypothetical protein
VGQRHEGCTVKISENRPDSRHLSHCCLLTSHIFALGVIRIFEDRKFVAVRWTGSALLQRTVCRGIGELQYRSVCATTTFLSLLVWPSKCHGTGEIQDVVRCCSVRTIAQKLSGSTDVWVWSNGKVARRRILRLLRNLLKLPGTEPKLRCEKPSLNRLSCGTVLGSLHQRLV